MVQIIEQDLLTFDCDVFCHQVNCQGKMRSGIAKLIREKYPKVYTEYKNKCDNAISHKNLLGHCQMVEIEPNRYCANLFGQLYYGYDNVRYTDESAVYCMFMNLYDWCNYAIYEFENYKRIKLGIPYKIGCGLGGGNWDNILRIINEIFNKSDVIDVYICKITD